MAEAGFHVLFEDLRPADFTPAAQRALERHAKQKITERAARDGRSIAGYSFSTSLDPFTGLYSLRVDAALQPEPPHG